MEFYNNKRYENLSDREMMELILMNQVNIFQMLYRANHFALDKFGGDLAKMGIHKDEAYLKLLEDADAFQMQYRSLKDKGEI